MKLGLPEIRAAVVELQLAKKWGVPWVLPLWSETGLPVLYQNGWVGTNTGGPVTIFTRESIDDQPEPILSLEEGRWVFFWMFSKGANRDFGEDVVPALLGVQAFCHNSPVVVAPVVKRWGLRAWCQYSDATADDSQALFRSLMTPHVRERGYGSIAMSMQTRKDDIAGVINIGFGELRSQTILSGLQIGPRINEGVVAQGLLADIDVSVQNEPALNTGVVRRLYTALIEIAEELPELGSEG